MPAGIRMQGHIPVVVDVTAEGFLVREMVEMSRDELQARTGARLRSRRIASRSPHRRSRCRIEMFFILRAE